MIINKLINNEAFYSLIEMFQRENKEVTNKVCNDKFKSFIVESEQYIFTDNLNDINKNILVNESFVGIDTDAKEYIQHHGKKPNGAGKWIFGIGSRNKKDWFSFDGNFTTAKNAAYEEAEKRGKKKIYVMEDFDFKFYDVRFKIIKENNNSHRVSLLVEDKELNVTKALTENSAKNIGAGWLLDKLIEIDLQEKKMTKKEKEKSEDIVHGMKKKIKSFKDRYGKNAKKVMYATANKLVKEDNKKEMKKSNMKESLEQKLKLLIEEESFKELSSEPTYRKPYKAVEAEPQFVDGWKIIDNLGQALAGVYKKDEAKTLVDILNSTSEVKTMGYKDLYIKDGEGEKIKDRSLKGVKLKESKSNGLINDIIENEYGTAHGGMQHFSRVNGKEYSWNYVNIKNGRYDVVLNKDKAIGIFYVIGSGETPVGKAKQKKGILKFNNEIEESTKNFKIKFEQKSEDNSQVITGEKIMAAPDPTTARKRVEEDSADLKGFRVISVEEVR